MRKTWQERWWEKVDRRDDDECWIFTGSTARGGYGSFWDGESVKRPRIVSAHRWSYTQFVGPIPDGLDVLHSCDTPACVNPAHLRIGTHAENMQDAREKGKFGGPDAGGRHHFSRLNDWDRVREIRRRFREGASRQSLAREYGVEYSGMCKIIAGKMWPEEAMGDAAQDSALFRERQARARKPVRS